MKKTGITALVLVLALALALTGCDSKGKELETKISDAFDSIEKGLDSLEEHLDNIESGSGETATAEPEPTATPEAESAEEPESAETEAAAEDGIRPSFKEALDSYEALMDKYIEFMENFDSDTASPSVLLEYAQLLAQYTEAMSDIDNMDEQEMNDAELKYYIEVTSRVSQKLLDAAL